MNFSFKDWLNEMTSCSSVGGGGSFTADIANFSVPLFSTVIRRNKKKHKKKKKKN